MTRHLASLLAALALALAPALASAQLLLTGVGSPPAGGGGGLTLTYQGSFVSPTNQSTPYTQAAAALGTATSDRIVVVGITSAATSTGTISTVTVGGVTATQAVNSPSAVVNALHTQFWYASVPTGSTGDIVVTPTAEMLRMGFVWWTITGTTQTAYAARSGANADGGFSGTSTNSPAAGTMTVPAGGVSMALCRLGTGSPTTPALSLLVGSGAVNTRFGASISGESQYMLAVDSNATGGVQWTCTQGASSNISSAALAWGP